MDARLDTMDKNLAVYNEQLKIHIEGTNLNRQEIKSLRSDLRPVERHVDSVNTILKFSGGFAILLAAFESIKNLLF